MKRFDHITNLKDLKAFFRKQESMSYAANNRKKEAIDRLKDMYFTKWEIEGFGYKVPTGFRPKIRREVQKYICKAQPNPRNLARLLICNQTRKREIIN